MTTHTQTSHAPKFATLEGLRGLGALMVVIGHTIPFWGGFSYGHVAGVMIVDIFYLLSGFVIAFAYETKIAEGWNVGRFMQVRLVRLYPLLLLSLALGCTVNLIILYGESDNWLSPLWKLGLTAFLIPETDHRGSIYLLNPPVWTLLYELLVNLIYILVWRWLSLKMLIIFVVLGALGLVGATSVFETLNVGADNPSTIGGFARAWFGFFLGVLLFRLFAQKRTASLQRGWRVLALMAAVTLIATIPLAGWWRQGVELFLVCGIAPLIIYAGYRMEAPKKLSGLFIWLGAISYALYLIHWPVFVTASRILPKLGLTEAQAAPYTGIAILVVSVVLAALAERYFDRPVRAWLEGQFRQRRSRSASEDLRKSAPDREYLRMPTALPNRHRSRAPRH